MWEEKIIISPGWEFDQETDLVTSPEGITTSVRDATTLSKIVSCPRQFDLKQQQIARGDVNRRMYAGIAMHEAMDVYYATFDPELAIEALRQKWGDADNWAASPQEEHLTCGHLEIVFKNYLDSYADDNFVPLTAKYEDLNLDNVIAAKLKVMPDETVILGESSFIMKFDFEGDTLILAGKPDLPIRNNLGNTYVMDHKTTSSYLGEFWSRKHQVSNKLRGYQAMMEDLLGIKTQGSVINGIYVGKYATNPKSTATKFDRYIFDFSRGHVEEALRNQLTWQRVERFYRELGYWPQSGNDACSYCEFRSICRSAPEFRSSVIATDYTKEEKRRFFDI